MNDNPPSKPSETDEILLQFRKQIDDIDDKIIALLLERTGIVTQVGKHKHQQVQGQCPIRPGREAEMLRRILAKFQSTPFSPAAAAGIWRLIIGASTAVEGDLTLSVYAPEKESDLFWLAREYFGMGSPVIKQPHVKRVIGDVMDGKAAVGIAPLIRGDDQSNWWTNLMQQGKDVPKIFAHVPFIYPTEPDRHSVGALAMACVNPEPSGDDISLLVLEADPNTSQHKLQSAFASAGLEATWISIATLTPASRHHLVQVKGFVPPSCAPMQDVLSSLGSSVLGSHFLGAYAVPVALPTIKPATNGAAPHAAIAKA